MSNEYMTLEQLRDALRDRRIYVVAEETGLSHTLLYKIINSDLHDCNLTYKTITTLSQYLQKNK